MHLRSIALKGFKSFPDRTKLDFTPGVSVIVGPNGSGKSNVTDAVLWALGEQSPLAVRGQSMQDVIFAGGHGLPSRSSAEVEVVIDNGDGGLPSEFSEISIVGASDQSSESPNCSRATEAASCSALFFVFPAPRPISSPSTSATAMKLRSCGGPVSSSIR